ncbi:DUF1214 domain-containing protein [Shimia sp. R11_0]|uniref:DUF1214 domain-containing protein n=1 Tax=Shimia sp. R11_0 TaxID=2821096 RepID=UPI001ADBD31F|nr:DUF1214 domain-containing protein [Shimia sp. R11_0]MBO9476717.1 DUF1214 domain-containing protein [Shimia sp. R11_0]
MNLQHLIRLVVSVSTAACAMGATAVPAIAQEAPVAVTVDNFVQAATAYEFESYAGLANGVNTFFHFLTPTPIDNQPTIRMNRDTLYSSAVVDIRDGATLSLPDVGDRYMTTMVVNQNHFINEVFHGGGRFELNMETFDTPYVLVFMRILVDANDPEDIAAVNEIQRGFEIDSRSAEPFVAPNYDREGFERVLRAAIELGRFATDSLRTFGSKSHVEPLRHFLGTAVGFGGLPEDEAFYLNVDPGLPVGAYKIDVPADVPVGAFWSVSLYNAEGFFEANDLDAYVVNSVSGVANDDGSFTVHLGGCEDGRLNCLPLMDGWNYTVRLYQPGPEVNDGRWVFPSVAKVN